MRLTCPNCDAQYEVDPKVIPVAGRDVQCSNCGHTWFQHPEGFDASAEAEPDIADTAAEPGGLDGDHEYGAATRAAEDADAPEDDLADGVQTDFHAAEAPEPADDADDPTDETQEEEPDHAAAFMALGTEREQVYEDEDDAAAPMAAGDEDERRGIDKSVLDILREEAERETRAREADAIETQAELGLDQTEPQERTAQFRSVEEDEDGQDDGTPAPDMAAVAAVAGGSRRELLPDIEEINSTLRSSSERGEDVPDDPEMVEQKRRSGFRLGFGVIVAVAVIAVLLYVFAPRIVSGVPQTERAMIGYVTLVNEGRARLDSGMERSLERLNAMLDELNES